MSVKVGQREQIEKLSCWVCCSWSSNLKAAQKGHLDAGTDRIRCTGTNIRTSSKIIACVIA